MIAKAWGEARELDAHKGTIFFEQHINPKRYLRWKTFFRPYGGQPTLKLLTATYEYLRVHEEDVATRLELTQDKLKSRIATLKGMHKKMVEEKDITGGGNKIPVRIVKFDGVPRWKMSCDIAAVL